jgi:DNA-binding protein HU-beta
MNKQEFVSKLKEKAGFTNEQAYKAIDGVFDVITEALEQGDSVTIQSFGTFEVRERAARKGINPQTKQPIDINASKAPALKVSYKLKERVNK